MTGHEHFRDLTAAYVVGALESDERDELEAHLRTCARCRQDVVAFAPLPALLGRVDPGPLDEGSLLASGDAVVAAVRVDVDRVHRSRGRWRRGAGVAAAAAAVLLGLAIGNGLDDEAPTRRGGGVALQVETAASGAAAQVIADERAWGTYVHVSAEDLPDRDAYTLWVVDEEGQWERAGSWARTPDGAADLGGSSQLTLAQIDRVVITSVDRRDELVVAR